MQFKNLEDSEFFGTKSIELDEDMIKLMNKFQYYSTYRILKSAMPLKNDYVSYFLSCVNIEILSYPHHFSYKDIDCINKMASRINND